MVISGSPIKSGDNILITIIRDLKMLTFIVGESLKVGPLLQFSTLRKILDCLLGKMWCFHTYDFF